METLGRTSHFRRGESHGRLTWESSGRRAASLELSTSTGVVALLDVDGARDDSSNWSDKDDNEESDDDSLFGVPVCIGFECVVDVGTGIGCVCDGTGDLGVVQYMP